MNTKLLDGMSMFSIDMKREYPSKRVLRIRKIVKYLFSLVGIAAFLMIYDVPGIFKWF